MYGRSTTSIIYAAARCNPDVGASRKREDIARVYYNITIIIKTSRVVVRCYCFFISLSLSVSRSLLFSASFCLSSRTATSFDLLIFTLQNSRPRVDVPVNYPKYYRVGIKKNICADVWTPPLRWYFFNFGFSNYHLPKYIYLSTSGAASGFIVASRALCVRLVMSFDHQLGQNIIYV